MSPKWLQWICSEDDLKIWNPKGVQCRVGDHMMFIGSGRLFMHRSQEGCKFQMYDLYALDADSGRWGLSLRGFYRPSAAWCCKK